MYLSLPGRVVVLKLGDGPVGLMHVLGLRPIQTVSVLEVVLSGSSEQRLAAIVL
jgi:hypothetical protein